VSRPSPEGVEDFLREIQDREWDYWIEEGGNASMDAIRDALADSLKSKQPKLYELLGEMVRLGESKTQIMNRIDHMIRAERREPQQGELTRGCCEAALDRFIEDRKGAR
jgi:hypothetical protein